MIENIRKNKNDLTMSPKEFANAIKKACELNQQLKQELTNQRISYLVHYLVLEQIGQVSFEKLHRAMNLDRNDAPLRQDKIDEILATKKAIN